MRKDLPMFKFRELNKINTKRLCMTALFAAICCAGTFIAVPLPIGYFNVGDLFVLCSGWALSLPVGAAAAASGSMLADILLGYASYAPATLIIKGAVALCAGIFHKILCKRIRHAYPTYLISAVLGECLMIGGYYLFEAYLLGFGSGAAASLPGNGMQALCAIVFAPALMTALMRNRAARNALL